MGEHMVGDFLSHAWSKQSSTTQTIMALVSSSVVLIVNPAMETMILGIFHSET